jgi:hypothetical protein
MGKSSDKPKPQQKLSINMSFEQAVKKMVKVADAKTKKKAPKKK